MRRLAGALAAAAVFSAGVTMTAGRADAAPIAAPAAIRDAANSLNMVERAQFIWLGRNYCWYDDGWNGPGWYWCGQYLSSGIGWGGGYGWHHWHGGHPGGGHAAVMRMPQSRMPATRMRRSVMPDMLMRQ